MTATPRDWLETVLDSLDVLTGDFIELMGFDSVWVAQEASLPSLLKLVNKPSYLFISFAFW